MNLRSLHARLAMGLLGVLVVTGVLNVATTLKTTQLYIQEMDQQLNAQLADRLTERHGSVLLAPEGSFDDDGFADLDASIGLFNPRLSAYLLYVDGQIALADSRGVSPQLDHVSLAPIRRFLERESPFPLLGDDPRQPDRPAIIAVSRVQAGDSTLGYLYLVQSDAVADDGSVSWLDSLKNSYILRLSMRNAVIYLSVVLLAGLLLFSLLTRRLRRLTRRMRGVLSGDGAQNGDGDRASAPSESIILRGSATHREVSEDDIASLERTFEEMKERIQHQMRELDRMAGLRNELISNISHDLRTPIASLQGYLDTLMLKEDVLSQEERDEYLQIALNQSVRLGKLVDELFEITRLENYAIQPQMERFRLAELVQDIVQGFQLKAEQKGVKVEADYDPDLPPVYVDVRLMERALENLIGNALRFTPPGGSVRVALEEGPNQFSVRVIDSGCGIAADDLPHIFDRFYQARFHGGKTSREGAGLGLAITRRIVELHQSTLEVTSRIGEGSTFSFSLPVAPRTHQIIGLDTEGLDAARVDALRRHLEGR